LQGKSCQREKALGVVELMLDGDDVKLHDAGHLPDAMTEQMSTIEIA